MLIAPQNIAVPSNNALNVVKHQRANENEQGDKTVTPIEKSNKFKEIKESEENKNDKEKDGKDTLKRELSQQEVSKIRDLRIRDKEVRAHEQAHLSAAGGLARGGASFDYKRGPDGQLYVIGGEVHIDTSTVAGDPEATAAKAQQVRRAALAPVQPSQQDRSIASAASATEAKARVEIAQQKTESAVEKLNDKVINEVNKSEEVKELEPAKNSEVTSKCPQCGGQHSADSHSVATTLGETFIKLGYAEQKGEAFSVAV